MPVISTPNAINPAGAIHSVADLARSLVQETSEIESLLAVLREEQHVLQRRELERVHALAQQKNEHLARLDAFAAARARFLASAGISADRGGMQSYIDAHPALPENVRAGWRRLLANAAEACQTNAVNGRLIAIQMRFTNGALAVLQKAATQLVCYGADGQTKTSTSSRAFASA